MVSARFRLQKMIILFLYKAAITRGNYSMDYPVEWLPFVVVSCIVSKGEATEFLLLRHNGCL